MAIKTSGEIIKAAIDDPETYKEMAKKESTFWGKMLADPERNERVKDAQAAAATLKKNRDMISLGGYIRSLKTPPKKGLVIGCGSGRAERNFIAQGICESFHGIDISEEAIAEARRIADKENIALTYEIADFNFINLPENQFDFVCAQTSLHHVLKLEHLISQIWQTLKPDGIFWVHDFIGETQFQWTDARLDIVNGIVDNLPSKLTYDDVNKRIMPKLVRPVPGTMGSPFESIRSGEIAPILKQWFDVEQKYEWGAITHHVMPPGSLKSYLENDDTKAIFELLLYLDKILLKYDVLPPTGAQYILKPKTSKQVSKNALSS
jgi:SAM-dependent methyltransferase